MPIHRAEMTAKLCHVKQAKATFCVGVVGMNSTNRPKRTQHFLFSHLFYSIFTKLLCFCMLFCSKSKVPN